MNGRLPAQSDQAARRTRVAVYGEIDMNLIDGSSVWLQSVTKLLATCAGVSVTLLLRVPEERDLLTGPLRESPNIEVVDPGRFAPAQPRMTPADAVQALRDLDDERGFDVLVVRGADAIEAVAQPELGFRGRLWPYYLPTRQRPNKEVGRVKRLAAGAHRVLCQTAELRERLLTAAPEAAGKVVLLPPMIPTELVAPAPKSRPDHGAPRLLYAGKLAPEYCFLEMVELLERLREMHPAAELHVAGDKIHNPPRNRNFKPTAEQALRETKNLIWYGAVSRDSVHALARTCDIALSLRDPRLSASQELSTKVLEYSAAGCPVLLNRAPVHERLLGTEYPLFADDVEGAAHAVVRTLENPRALADAAAACYRASQRYTVDRVAAEIDSHLPRRPATGSCAGRRIAVAGHDLKFFAPIAKRLAASGSVLRDDVWHNHREHSESVSKQTLKWADTIVCEWCLGNANWYSRHSVPGQSVVVRFHRVELETDYPHSLDLDRVSALIFVSEHILEEAVERFGWPRDRLRVISNAVDRDRFALPKLPDARFNLGLVGWAPIRKRLDRALDLLERLRAREPRFRLVVRGRPPWEFRWIWEREGERRYFEELFERLCNSRLLGSAVSFESFGGDLPEFFQKIGFVLSVSDHEGHQVAPAEGMASGAIPVVIDRAGARDDYADEWVHASTLDAAEAILATIEDGNLAAERRRVAAYTSRWSYDMIMPLWDEVLGLDSIPADDSAISHAPPRTGLEAPRIGRSTNEGVPS